MHNQFERDRYKFAHPVKNLASSTTGKPQDVNGWKPQDADGLVVGVPNRPSAYENPVGVRCGGPHKTASGRSVSPHTPTALPSASECRLFLFFELFFNFF